MTKRPISRRKALVGLILMLAVGLIGTFRSRESKQEAMVRAVLRSRIGFLWLDSDGIQRFAEEFRDQFSPNERWKLTLLAVAFPAYPFWLGHSTPFIGERLARFEAQVVTAFLLGSDFFREERDEIRTIRFVGHYDPYSLICGNPCARFD